jgi:D-alanyl-D-alanine dipeptidase
MVGLGNVDNTSDANKPISTATQTALDAKASLSGATFTGSVEIDQNLTVDGNLTVNGTTFNASSTSIVIEDNMVQLAHQNAGNSVDLGLVVAYNDGAAKHAGLVRDVSDSKWKLFQGVTSEPSTTVNFGQGSLDALAVGALEATTVTPSSGVIFSDGTQTKEGVPSRTPIIQKTAAYTLSALTERDSLVEVSHTGGSAVNVTIPADSTLNFPIGTSIDVLQTNTGSVAIAGAGGVTVNATPGLTLRTQWSSATLLKRAANTWVVYGDLK